MINIDPALKTIYRNDRFPMSTVAHPKDMEARFAGLNLTVAGDQFADDKGEFELTEGICFDSNLKFGKCNSAKVKFTVADVTDEITGKEFYLKQTVDDTYDMPFGYFTVNTCPKQDDLRFKDITAYDRMKSIEVDVAGWYNSLTFPMTLGAFRASLLAFFGLEEDVGNLPLPNDSMTVEKTVEAAQMPGREVIEAVEELNGVFGVINPEGKFEHVILKPGYGLYPSDELYPSDNLYPVSENDATFVQSDLVDETVTIPMRESIRFQEYTVPEIDKLVIRSEEDDIGAIAGTGTNAYIIEGNFLVFGKSAAELQVIATNAFGYMAKRPYRSYESNQIGLPYVKPGDMLKFDQDEPVTGYMLNRTLKGVQGLRDEIAAPGTHERKQNTSQNTEIIKLKYKTTKLKVDIDGVLIDVEDLAESTASRFEQTASLISTSVNALDEQLSGEINVLAGQVELKVDAAGVISAINLSPEGIKISASNIALEGIVTANSRFKILADGSMEAVNGKFSGQLVAATGTFTGTLYGADGTFTGTLNGNTIVSPNISGGNISGTVITSTGPGIGSVEINGAYIRGRNTSGNITLDIWPGGIETTGNVQCNTLNGYAPINSGNIGGQSVAYATNAGSVFISENAHAVISQNYISYARVSAADNFIPSSNQMYIGSSGNPWAGGYGVSGWITTSDERKKYDIRPADDRFKKFARMLKPMLYKLKDGTSGRDHLGWTAQQVKKAMDECGISAMEFAGYIESPVYAKKLLDEDGNETQDYDTSSEIIDYTGALRYEEFIPLMLFCI